MGIISRFTDGRYLWEVRATGHVLKHQPPCSSFSFPPSALSLGSHAIRALTASKASRTEKPKIVSELQSRTELVTNNQSGPR